MSWGQAWKSFADKAKDAIFKLFGKENNLKQIIDKYPAIIKALKENMRHPAKSNNAKPCAAIKLKKAQGLAK